MPPERPTISLTYPAAIRHARAYRSRKSKAHVGWPAGKMGRAGYWCNPLVEVTCGSALSPEKRTPLAQFPSASVTVIVSVDQGLTLGVWGSTVTENEPSGCELSGAGDTVPSTVTSPIRPRTWKVAVAVDCCLGAARSRRRCSRLKRR
jgi:hypothetical protein